MNKRGANILAENIVFIVLNVVFLMILILFLFSKMSDVAPLEEKYAKQIALLIDGAKPGMNITLDMTKDVDKVKNKNLKVVSIEGNIVNVKFDEDSKGFSYSFFNNVELSKLYFYAYEKKFSFVVEGYK